jgi:uncharacterized phage-associated protein
MPVTIHRFNLDKVVEAILLVASKVPEPTLQKISKMFYFADKLHLQRYGCVLSDDTYHAMEYGPVPSHIYNIMKYAGGAENLPPTDKSPAIRSAMKLLADRRTVSALRDPNLDVLSESEVECLLDAINEHGKKSFGRLSDETHDSAWKSVAENEVIPLKAIVDTLPNAEEVSGYLYA